MANRDHSQGIGFMYVNIAKALEERKQVAVESPAPVMTENVQHVNFNKDREVPKTDGRKEAIGQIRENLDRLQSLHHRLHAMLEELNKISAPKKK